MWYTIVEERKVKANEKLNSGFRFQKHTERFRWKTGETGKIGKKENTGHGGATHYINRSRNFIS